VTRPGPAVRPGPPLRRRSWLWQRIFRPYAAAWLYLGGFCLAEIAYGLLPAHDQAALLQWASTNVHNLTHDPVGCLLASAFFPAAAFSAWPFLIALSLFGANRVLGNWRTIVTCMAGNVIGSLVSEGILGYRITHGTMPGSDRFIIDVGPSYVVVTALAVALLWGSRIARAAAAIALAGLSVVGHIFSGLASLQVAPVGHATALFVGATLGSALAWDRRRRLTHS
jgi:Rhomboid-like protein